MSRKQLGGCFNIGVCNLSIRNEFVSSTCMKKDRVGERSVRLRLTQYPFRTKYGDLVAPSRYFPGEALTSPTERNVIAELCRTDAEAPTKRLGKIIGISEPASSRDLLDA